MQHLAETFVPFSISFQFVFVVSAPKIEFFRHLCFSLSFNLCGNTPCTFFCPPGLMHNLCKAMRNHPQLTWLTENGNDSFRVTVVYVHDQLTILNGYSVQLKG